MRCFFIFIVMFLGVLQNSGAKEYVVGVGRIDVEISVEGVNKISVEGDRIAAVVGSDDEYNIEGDNSKGVVFIASKLSSDEVLPVTIMTEKGFSWDINLNTMGKLDPQHVVLKPRLKKKPLVKEVIQNKFDHKQKVTEWVKQLINGDIRDFTFRKFQKFDLQKSCYEDACKFYRLLLFHGVEVIKTSEYSNRYAKIYRYEFIKKPAELAVEEVVCGGECIAVGEFGNVIFVVVKGWI